MRCAGDIPLVTTIKERCRICFTCVRECPAKAIRIADGQAEVLPKRCIGCGNCVRVCSQNAKLVYDSTPVVRTLLESGAAVGALVAPSFPADFTDCSWREFVGMLRALGFRYVHEVGFGADLVARRYRQIMDQKNEQRYIATTCPAVIAFVEQYHPDLTPFLAPVVSPMIAMARAFRRMRGREAKAVFIGPCIAKKGEVASENVPNELNAAITFIELRQLLSDAGISPDRVVPSDFDPPHASLGGLFPVSRGLLQTADLAEDILHGEVTVAGGHHFVQALCEFADGDLTTRLLEILACDGCIMGPAISSDAPLFRRRAQVSRYVRDRQASLDPERLRSDIAAFDDLDLSRPFKVYDQRPGAFPPHELKGVLARMGKHNPADELNCGACGYDTCRDHAAAILGGLAETEMCLPYAIETLHNTVRELASSNRQLASTQEALLNSERLASMGQLAAGIAHEVNNPLGVVLMYTHLLLEEHGEDQWLQQDLKTIVEQADRCKKIVAGLLNFARQTKVLRQPLNLCDLVERTLHTLPPPANVTIEISDPMDNPMADLDRDQIAQVLTNLISNAYHAMEGGGLLKVRTSGNHGNVCFQVSDTGPGIPRENLTKVLEPFFTTKQIGKGTGLGLAVSYGIVKMHNGQITVESNADASKGPTGSTFTVNLPRAVPIG